MKENLKPCVYKHTKHVKVRCGTFCRMVRRVIVRGVVKDFRSAAEGKPSVNSTNESLAIDPKPGDLSMSRLKLPERAMEDRTDPR